MSVRLVTIILALVMSQGFPFPGPGTPHTAGGGGITKDSGSPVNTTPTTAAGPNTVNLTIGAGCTNPVLTVSLNSYDSGTPFDVTALSYNGTSILANVIYNVHPQSGERVAAFYLINPTHDGAAHTLSYTMAGATSGGSYVAAVAWCGANQTTPIRTSNTASAASGTTASVALSSASGDVYMAHTVWPAASGITGTVGDSATTIASDTNAGSSAYKTGLAGSSTPSTAISSGGGVWTMGAFSVQQ